MQIGKRTSTKAGIETALQQSPVASLNLSYNKSQSRGPTKSLTSSTLQTMRKLPGSYTTSVVNYQLRGLTPTSFLVAEKIWTFFLHERARARRFLSC